MSFTQVSADEISLLAGPWSPGTYYAAGTKVLTALELPNWTTATRPASPRTGRIGWNTDLQALDEWTGAAWVSGGGAASVPWSGTIPLGNSGIGTAGVAATAARGDHVHPVASLPTATLGGLGVVSPDGTTITVSGGGVISGIIAGAAASSTAPAMDGVAAPGVGGTYARADHVHPADTSRAAVAAIRGHLGGLGLSNDGTLPNTVLDIAAGTCTDSTNAVTITLGAFTKSIARLWVSGTGANGMGQGLTATASTWYHVFAVIVSGAADVYFDTSVTAANKPASTTAFRRIGSFRLDASVHILAFAQNVDRFDWTTPVQEFIGVPGVTTAVTQTLVAVPPGVSVEAILTGACNDATPAGGTLYLSSLAQADMAVSTAALTCQWPNSATNVTSYAIRVVTNTSGQIRRRINTTTATIYINTNGWIDTRGRG